ncbi:MAG: nucleotidyltransferase family protein [bacterium]
MSLRIQIDEHQISEFCHRHHIRSLAFFGSVLRDDFRPDSDIDVLIEFEQGHVPGLLTLMTMQLEFSEILGREADFRTPRDLGIHFRDRVVAEAEVLYAA